jgi:hypothetical protein
MGVMVMVTDWYSVQYSLTSLLFSCLLSSSLCKDSDSTTRYDITSLLLLHHPPLPPPSPSVSPSNSPSVSVGSSRWHSLPFYPYPLNFLSSVWLVWDNPFDESTRNEGNSCILTVVREEKRRGEEERRRGKESTLECYGAGWMDDNEFLELDSNNRLHKIDFKWMCCKFWMLNAQMTK